MKCIETCSAFADDTTISCSGKSLKRLLEDIQIKQVKRKYWFNNMSLNSQNTKFMVFTNRKNEVKLCNNGVTIRKCPFRFLEVYYFCCIIYAVMY